MSGFFSTVGRIAAATLSTGGVRALAAGTAITGTVALTIAEPVQLERVVGFSPVESKKLHHNITVLDSRAIRALFSVIRDEKTSPTDFAFYADRLMRILAEEGLANLSTAKYETITTPCGIYPGIKYPDASTLCAVSIVRAGDTLLEAVRACQPGISVGKILIQRDESDPEKRCKQLYVKLPPKIKEMQVILTDPMLATGGSACKAIESLVNAGVPEENIMFLNVVSCPEGLRRMAKLYPRVKVVTAAVDAKLNSDKYIVPGLGDYGDRYYGTIH